MSTRIVHWLWPIPARRVVAGALIVLGLGRLGLWTYATGTVVDDHLYGVVLLILAGALLATGRRRAFTWYGRTVAALTAGVLAGLAYDLWYLAGHVNTSVMIVVWLTIVLIFESAARYDC